MAEKEYDSQDILFNRTWANDLANQPQEILEKIALELPLEDLQSLCRVNRDLALRLCNSTSFWALRGTKPVDYLTLVWDVSEEVLREPRDDDEIDTIDETNVLEVRIPVNVPPGTPLYVPLLNIYLADYGMAYDAYTDPEDAMAALEDWILEESEEPSQNQLDQYKRDFRGALKSNDPLPRDGILIDISTYFFPDTVMDRLEYAEQLDNIEFRDPPTYDGYRVDYSDTAPGEFHIMRITALSA